MSQLSNTSSLENARATKNGIDPIQDFPARRDRQFRANPVLMGDTRCCARESALVYADRSEL